MHQCACTASNVCAPILDSLFYEPLCVNLNVHTRTHNMDTHTYTNTNDMQTQEHHSRGRPRVPRSKQLVDKMRDEEDCLHGKIGKRYLG